MRALSAFLLARLTEPSTWAGVGAVAVSAAQAWVTRDPQAIAATLAGVLAVVVPERRP